MGIKLEYVYSDGHSLRTSFGKRFVFDAENYGMEQPETLTLRTYNIFVFTCYFYDLLT